LTVLHECLVSLPEEDFLYLGDDARFPYGTKAPAEVRARVEAASRYLVERGAKLLVLACNSATAAGLDAARGRIGVLATPTTVEGGAYHRALERQGRGLDVVEVEAPDLAPIIQRGTRIDADVVEIVRSYCAPLQRAEVDTVILGCTHYPLVRPMLQRILGRDVRLVTAGHAIAATVQRTLEAAGLETENRGEGSYRFLCTGDPYAFRELGTRFLQLPLDEVERVELA
jgi:glutamate racemase